MNNAVVLPLLLPLCTAAVLLFFAKNIFVQRAISLIGSVLHICVSIYIVLQVKEQGMITLHMGGWLPPYGIVFAADMTAALLTAAAAIVGGFCLLYAIGTVGAERERHYFYPLVQFLLAGVCGSFLTGDLFNLFVCFEVLLIASYSLLVLGGEKKQLRETLKYMIINIFSSTMFVAAMAYLYGVTGTLNMAHLSERIAQSQSSGILEVIAVLLMVVFALKAGLFLFFWLPGSYSAPPAAIAALFGALLTKVGIYALIRTFTLLYMVEGSHIQLWLGIMAGLTMVLGAIGAIAYSDIQRILNYNVIISVGFIIFGLVVATRASLEGAIVYLLHDMVAKALLYMLGGLIVYAAGTNKITEMGGLLRRYPLLGWMFLLTALAVAGLPPLSGFPGKVLLIRSGLQAEYYLLAALSVLSSFIVLYSLIRIFMYAFWGKEQDRGDADSKLVRLPRSTMASAAGLLIIVIGMGFGAEWVYRLAAHAGELLASSNLYIEAVLK